MSFKALSIGCALLAAVAAVPAQALTFSSFSGSHDAVESASEVLVSGANTFSGKFEFSLDSLSEVSFFGVTTIPAFGLGLFDSAGQMLAGTLLSPFSGNTVTSTVLDAGSYYYAAVFPQGSAGASYAFESHVSPVPEPGVFAMLAAGLGVVGFFSRRRRNQQ